MWLVNWPLGNSCLDTDHQFIPGNEFTIESISSSVESLIADPNYNVFRYNILYITTGKAYWKSFCSASLYVIHEKD